MALPINCLIVDDDIDDQEIFAIAVRELKQPYNCNYILSAIDALELLKTSAIPDYIFLDFNMPKMNGMECLIEIKKMSHLSHIPVVIYSTSSGQNFIDEALKNGAVAFITKPPRISDLVMILKNFFAQHEKSETN